MTINPLLRDSMIASSLANETAAYLSRGRRFSATDNASLLRRWPQAFRKWFVERSFETQVEMDDLFAEMRLRNIPLPEHKIASESVAMQREIDAYGPEVQQAVWRHAIAKYTMAPRH
jgi:hypothetical protein